jgi:hypothetical protein
MSFHPLLLALLLTPSLSSLPSHLNPRVKFSVARPGAGVSRMCLESRSQRQKKSSQVKSQVVRSLFIYVYNERRTKKKTLHLV